MENYIKTKNIISNVCNQSGLSPIELSGVLNECLSELRYAMLTNAVAETMQVKEQFAHLQDDLKKYQEKSSEEESE
ncbi:MAG: hypothetical protein IJI95_03275 [Clostridia bacterium]|nr:hypothetical protein [Clostridia bacterium]MBR0364843.1 hypothetical protein [Clostridia bacterium]